MRNVILIFIITLVLFNVKVNAQQPYKKLIPNENIPKYWGYFVGASLGDTWNASQLFSKDTIINSKSYRIYNNGFMREDSVNRKVYFLPKDLSSTEFLLYDFSLNVNDSFYFNFNTPKTEKYSAWYRVDTVYSDTISPFGMYFHYLSEKRKIFRFKSNYPQYRNIPLYWIEGLGSNMTPLYTYDCFNRDTGFIGANGCRTTLLCVVEGLDLKFQSYPECLKNLHISLNELSVNNILQIYPNPTSQYLFLNYSDNAIKFIRYNLSDINGKIIYHSDAVYSNDPIEVSSLKSGFYLLHIKDLKTKQEFNFKFIKE